VTLVDLPQSVRTCPNLAAGAFGVPEGAPLSDVRSPYTGALIARVPMSSAAEVARVVAGAKQAAEGWRVTPVKERSQRMFRFRQLLEQNLERLAHSVAAESGKTVTEARAGVLKGMEVVEYACSIQNLDTGASLEVSRGVYCEYRREPLGVVAGITPFNFPAMVPMWMFPIAITVGNAFVLKPSEKVPMTPGILGELMLEAGFPPGVFSIVNGGKEAVEALCTHPDVAALGFVGSSQVARHVYELGTSRGKRVLALGGAKNHLIVVPDADKELAAQAIVDSFTGCAGQRCMAGSVMVAVGDVEHVVEEVRRRAAALEIGAQMGAIIDQAALGRIKSAIDAAEREGAKILVDGRTKAPPGPEYAGGSWIGPTVIDGVTPSMGLASLEIFGPVLAVVRVSTMAEAMAVENKNPYGNAASVFTTSGGVAQYVAEHARAGMIGINVGVPVPREPFSFGGIQESKFGHGDITGESGVEFWSSLKKITRKWSVQHDATWMS